MDQNIAIQATTECIKSITHFGSTTWVNICTNQMTTLQWGFGDWMAVVLVGVFMLFFLGMFINLKKTI